MVACEGGRGDEQVLNRMLNVWIDEGEKQDRKVLARSLRSVSQLPQAQVHVRLEHAFVQAMWVGFSPRSGW